MEFVFSKSWARMKGWEGGRKGGRGREGGKIERKKGWPEERDRG